MGVGTFQRAVRRREEVIKAPVVETEATPTFVDEWKEGLLNLAGEKSPATKRGRPSKG